MEHTYNEQLFSFLAASPTAYHAAAHASSLLEAHGYRPLCESESWALEEGGKYYVTRNGSSLIAFRLPRRDFAGFMMAAAHCDSPAFKVKENEELTSGPYVKLSVEKYGGMLCSTWMDRPLSIAGRVVVGTPGGVECRLVDFSSPVCLIPNVAIHMNRKANDGFAYNAAVDMLPLYGGEEAKGTFRARLAKLAGCAQKDILSTDLFLYNPQGGTAWSEYLSAPRLDDLQCAFAALTALLESEDGESVPLCCIFDNEEVGSQTKQGAASTFLRDVLRRIAGSCGRDCRTAVANSFLVSCDNAHAVHPNHPEFSDPNHTVKMNGGVVIKYNANQKYTSDGVSSAIFRALCAQAGVPVQSYANRADLPGGSTLGSIANTQVSLNSVDVGLPQLAMHSAFETAGAADTAHLIAALTVFYAKTLRMEADGRYALTPAAEGEKSVD